MIISLLAMLTPFNGASDVPSEPPIWQRDGQQEYEENGEKRWENGFSAMS